VTNDSQAAPELGPKPEDFGRGTLQLATIGDWLSPHGETDLRRAGHYALQLATDTIAYAQNIPIRILLVDRLRTLPESIRTLLLDKDIQGVIKSDVPDLAESDYGSLSDEGILRAGATWLTGLVFEQSPERPAEIPPGWEQGLVSIMSHLERQVWLTEMGNPLPAHSLCRMHDYWALNILLWSWLNCSRLTVPGSFIGDALNIDGLHVGNAGEFSLKRMTAGEYHKAAVIIGPYFSLDDFASENRLKCHERFLTAFDHFISNTDRAAIALSSHTLPLREELADALEGRIPLNRSEVHLRSQSVYRSLGFFLGVCVDIDLVVENTLPRDVWESIAVLSAWIARWGRALIEKFPIEKTYDLFGLNEPHRLLLTNCQNPKIKSSAGSKDSNWHLSLSRISKDAYGYNPIESLLDELNSDEQSNTSYRIDRPEIFLNRTRERQNASWSAQIIAINNMLSRHGPRSVALGRDSLRTPRTIRYADEAEHLLRGFGGRICRYLVSITRADVVDIYWLDYGQSPPRLVSAGGFARVVAHRAHREDICREFDRWAWKDGAGPENLSPSNLRGFSPSQAYRVASTGSEDPRNGDRPEAYFGGYPDPVPQDAMAVPLLVNGRVVGVMTLAGLSKFQFSRRLYAPLRRAANLVGTSMYAQSQIWQTRRLNWIFANFGAAHLGSPHRKNPLTDVARCLANIFLCPVAHTWLKSQSSDIRFELTGYNWDPIFLKNGEKEVSRSPEFEWHRSLDGSKSPARNPSKDAFAVLAIDLWESKSKASVNSALGRFIFGQFDPIAETTTGYDFDTASTSGTKFGSDFLPPEAINSFEPSYLVSRRRLFGRLEQGGHELDDIMAFPLVRPRRGSAERHEVVGVVTLHDWSDAQSDTRRGLHPWDLGWATVVAHVQTYLPYLLTQAEVLDNPMIDARRFLIHAGRAELIAVLDTMHGLRSQLENCLAPDKGLRSSIDQILSPGFAGDSKSLLQRAQLIAEQTWSTVQIAASPVWEQSLTQLANVMQNYRELLGDLEVKIAVSDEDFELKVEVSKLIAGYEKTLRSEGVFKDIEIPSDLALRMPLLWFRVIIGDLVHNAAKYANSGRALRIAWDQNSRTLEMSNSGPYDPALDSKERLGKRGMRGSAARVERRGIRRPTGVDRQGQGLGLWGAKLLCEVMNVGFEFDIQPEHRRISGASQTLRPASSAMYSVKITFPAVMIRHQRHGASGIF
jgi:hypothetical protein